MCPAGHPHTVGDDAAVVALHCALNRRLDLLEHVLLAASLVEHVVVRELRLTPVPAGQLHSRGTRGREAAPGSITCGPQADHHPAQIDRTTTGSAPLPRRPGSNSGLRPHWDLIGDSSAPLSAPGALVMTLPTSVRRGETGGRLQGCRPVRAEAAACGSFQAEIQIFRVRYRGGRWPLEYIESSICHLRSDNDTKLKVPRTNVVSMILSRLAGHWRCRC